MNRAEQLRAWHHDVLYVLAGISRVCTALQGPRGTFRSGEVVARSQFERYDRSASDPTRTGWRWVAFDVHGKVLHVIEFPDVLEGCYDTPEGALWSLRACIADHFHDVRSHRGH